MAAMVPAKKPNAQDRLSNLPEAVIINILSFLPTKIAATTAVLSKRWRFLFRYSPVYDIDEGWEKVPKLERQRTRARFSEFVYKLLFTLEPSQIRTFRLKCKILSRTDSVNNWVCAVIKRCVKELDLDVCFRRFEIIHSEIFNCQTLCSLKLLGNFIFEVPTSVHLPNLVNLHLDSVRLTDGTCLRRISSSPLKTLKLCNCKFDSNSVLEVAFPVLTNLILHRYFLDYKIALNTPKLECLEYSAYGTGFLIVKERMPALITADIDFEVTDDDQDLEQTDEQLESSTVYGRYAKKIMTEIHHVNSLRLSGTTLEVLCYSPCSWPSFHNLTSMVLGINQSMGWHPLPKLLETTPYLQELNFIEGLTNRSCSKLEFEFCLPDTVPTCLSEHLRIIEIQDFVGMDCEFELVEYFLKNAMVLERIKLRSEMFWGWPSSFCERLLGYRRGSTICSIVVSWKVEEKYLNKILC